MSPFSEPIGDIELESMESLQISTSNRQSARNSVKSSEATFTVNRIVQTLNQNNRYSQSISETSSQSSQSIELSVLRSLQYSIILSDDLLFSDFFDQILECLLIPKSLGF